MYINEALISDIVHENLDLYQETESKTTETAETTEGEEDEIDFLDGEIIIPEDVDPFLNAFKVGLVTGLVGGPNELYLAESGSFNDSNDETGQNYKNNTMEDTTNEIYDNEIKDSIIKNVEDDFLNGEKNILERNDLIMNTLKNDDNSNNQTVQNNNIQSMIDNTDEVESFLNNIDETDFLDRDNNIPLENDIIINTLEHDGIVTGLKGSSIRLKIEDGSNKTNYNIENIYDKTVEIDDFEIKESILDNGMIDTQKDANEIPPNEALNNNVDSKDERREVDDDEKIDEAMR